MITYVYGRKISVDESSLHLRNLKGRTDSNTRKEIDQHLKYERHGYCYIFSEIDCSALTCLACKKYCGENSILQKYVLPLIRDTNINIK